LTSLQLVVVVGDVGNDLLDTLSLAHSLDDLAGFGGGVEDGSTGKTLPMVEDHLRESLATSVLAEIGSKAERLVDREVGLDVEEGCAGTLLLREDVTTTAGEDTVDTAHSLLWNLDLDNVHGLEESGVGEEGGGVEDTAGSGDNLSSTTVDGVGMEGDVHNVEADGTHGLLGNGTLAGGPLETRDNGILDFVEVLDGLGLVNEQVGTVGVGTEAPNLTGVLDVPSVLVGEDTGASLEIVTRTNLARLNVLGNLLGKGLSNNVDTVVLVGRLGEGSDGGLAVDSLTVLDDGRRDAERNTSVVLLEILQANLQMQLTGTGNNVLTRVGNVGKDTRVRLGETLETFDELGKIVGVLDLDGDLDDGRDGELHDLQVVGSLGGSEGTRLEQELIDTDETENVSGGNILNGLNVASHHENGALDGLDEEILLAAGNVVGALDADLEAGTDGSREDTAKGVETTLIRGRHHLGDVQHEGSLGIAVLDANAALVVGGTLVESLGTVGLSSDGRGEMKNHHLQESISSGQELAHDKLEESFALEVALVRLELNLELGEEGGGLLLLEVHDGTENLEDGVQDELVEGTVKLLAVGISAVLGPLLGLGVEVVVAPETLHHLLLVDTELLGVAAGKLADSEGPAVETGTESDGTLVGVDLDVTERLVKVGGDDDVDGLDGTGEGLVQVLLGDLEFEESTVNLVDDANGLDALGKSLAQDSLGLDTDTLNAIDDNESTIGDTEGSSNFGREIDVTGRVNQVDQEGGTVSLLGNVLDILLGHFGEQGDGGGLDGNATILLVLPCVGETGLTSLCGRNDTSPLDEGVGECGLSVIDVSNDRHVTNVRNLVHQGTDLVDGKVDHLECFLSRAGLKREGNCWSFGENEICARSPAIKTALYPLTS